MTSRKGGWWLPNVSYKGQKQQSSYRSDVSHIHFGSDRLGCVQIQRPSRREARRRNQLRYEARQRVGIGLFLLPLTHQEIDVLLMVAQLFH